MMNASLKVANQASATILLFVEAMERGRLTFDEAYPNGMADVAISLMDPIVTKLEAPADQVRLDVIGLDQDTDAEEQFMHLRDTLTYLLTILSHKQPILLLTQLVKCLAIFERLAHEAPSHSQMQTYTQLYQVFLALLEIYQHRRLNQLIPTYEASGA